jgi:hypothetical protein
MMKTKHRIEEISGGKIKATKLRPDLKAIIKRLAR